MGTSGKYFVSSYALYQRLPSLEITLRPDWGLSPLGEAGALDTSGISQARLLLLEAPTRSILLPDTPACLVLRVLEVMVILQ